VQTIKKIHSRPGIYSFISSLAAPLLLVPGLLMAIMLMPGSKPSVELYSITAVFLLWGHEQEDIEYISFGMGALSIAIIRRYV